MTATVVIGLGNTILSDDGVGVRAVERLRMDARVPEDITVVDGGTLGLELLSYAAGAQHLLVIDAIDVAAAPGTLLRLEGSDLRGLSSAASVHQLGVADLLTALRMMGAEPDEVVLLGVQPAMTDLGTELSPQVQGALDELLDAAVRELARLRHTEDDRCVR